MCEICEEAEVFQVAMSSAMAALSNRADEHMALPNVVRLCTSLSDQFRTMLVQETVVQGAMSDAANLAGVEYDFAGKVQDYTNRELIHGFAVAFMSGVEFGRTGREICTWNVDEDHD